MAKRPLVLIRINPDKYKIADKMIGGCFEFDKRNILKCLTREFDLRFNRLAKRIKFYLDEKPGREVTIEKLFFDK